MCCATSWARCPTLCARVRELGLRWCAWQCLTGARVGALLLRCGQTHHRNVPSQNKFSCSAGGMEAPRDDHKLTHNTRLATRDKLFGGTVSRLQVRCCD